MAPITAHFGLPDDVPFLDVDADRDTATFLCPFTARFLSTHDRWAARFVATTDSFMHTVIALLTSPDAAKRSRGQELLSQFKEPEELRLGYTKSGCRGHGAARVLGSRLAHALTTDLEAFLRIGLLNRLEDLQVFVNGVGNDVVSDAAGRIGLDVLVSYTREMMAQYPQLSHGPDGTVSHTYATWDTAREAWVDKTAVLPKVRGRALVLVPALWADPNPIVSKERFLDLTSMTMLQDIAADLDGRLTSKADLKKAQRPFSAAEINLRVVRTEWERHTHNLMGHFHAAALQTLQRRLGLTA